MNFLRLVNSILCTYGISLKRLLRIRFIPRVAFDAFRFLYAGGKITALWPIYAEDNNNSSSSISDYALLSHQAFSLINQRKPCAHFDVGSSVEKFLLPLSQFQSNLTYIDVRPSPALDNLGLHSLIVDLSLPLQNSLRSSVSSLSCLHVIEHIGLGRYGDRITSSGQITFATNIYDMLSSGGYAYIGMPFGFNQVYFNAHMLMTPYHYIDLFSCFFIEKLIFIRSSHNPEFKVFENPVPSSFVFENLYAQGYTAGLFVLRK